MSFSETKMHSISSSTRPTCSATSRMMRLACWRGKRCERAARPTGHASRQAGPRGAAVSPAIGWRGDMRLI